MYKIMYDAKNEVILTISPDGEKTIIADNYPSQPSHSPDKLHATYISPLEWEVPGSLFLYDLKSNTLEKIITPDEKRRVPKTSVWLNNHMIAVIIGFVDGTVSIGGNVYTFNILDNTLKQLTDFDTKIQITELNFNDKILFLNGIEYIDDAISEFKPYNSSLNIEDII